MTSRREIENTFPVALFCPCRRDRLEKENCLLFEIATQDSLTILEHCFTKTSCQVQAHRCWIPSLYWPTNIFISPLSPTFIPNATDYDNLSWLWSQRRFLDQLPKLHTVPFIQAHLHEHESERAVVVGGFWINSKFWTTRLHFGRIFPESQNSNGPASFQNYFHLSGYCFLRPHPLPVLLSLCSCVLAFELPDLDLFVQ